jgi:hypothetical protein
MEDDGGVLLGIQNKLPMVVAGVHEGKNEINTRMVILNSVSILKQKSLTYLK